MQRYLIELSYKGTHYSGFQVQRNANSIQAEVEKALNIFLGLSKSVVSAGDAGISLTGSSRTDAGVHARQNFFHFDTEIEISPAAVYNLNAILPQDISVESLEVVPVDFHCRFSALSRSYQYLIYRKKDPFLNGYAWHYPYKIDFDALQRAAATVKEYTDFTSFSKRNTQVKTFNCTILESAWREDNNLLIYEVKANRFLRGMVRALVATMLKVGRGTINLDEFKAIIEAKNGARADFSAPGLGLYLMKVEYGSET